MAIPSIAAKPQPDDTNCILDNYSSQVLKLDGKITWIGPEIVVTDIPREIPKREVRQFTYRADPRNKNGGSAGGLLYVFGEGNKFKWIIAWNNSDIEKVYTQILEDDVVDWNEVESTLFGSSTSNSGQHLRDPYWSCIEINPTGDTKTVKAKLGQQITVDDSILNILELVTVLDDQTAETFKALIQYVEKLEKKCAAEEKAAAKAQEEKTLAEKAKEEALARLQSLQPRQNAEPLAESDQTEAYESKA